MADFGPIIKTEKPEENPLYKDLIDIIVRFENHPLDRPLNMKSLKIVYQKLFGIDINDRVRSHINGNQMADEIQQMLEAKRHLLLAISHELRSPMTRVKVSLELLKDENKREEINQDLVEMDNLFAELLETERLNTRHSVLNKSHVSLEELVKEMEGEFFRNLPFTVDLSSPDIQFISMLRALNYY